MSRPFFAMAATVALCSSVCLFANPAGQIPARAEPARVQALASHHPLWANAANDAGVVPPDQQLSQLTLVLARTPDQQAAFEQFLADQQNPASPNYHHWLTSVEIGERFGVSDADIAAITSWVESQGLRVNWVAPSRLFIGFSGTASNVGRAFQTQLRTYRVNGAERMSVASEPAVPQQVAPLIKAVRGLYIIDEHPYHQLNVHSADSPDMNSVSGSHYIAPYDFGQIYDLTNISASGTGVSIGIVGLSRTNFADFDNFRQKTGVNFPNPTEVVPTSYGGVDPGPAYTAPPSGSVSLGPQSEATLDVLRAGSVAPLSKLLLVVSSPSRSNDPLGSDAQYLVQTTPVPAQVMNISFGACESSAGAAGVAFWDSLFQQAAAEGISVFVSSGDAGASGCDTAFATPPSSPAANSPNYICSSSYATCVGGTQFNDTANPSQYWDANNGFSTLQSALSYIPEGAWNEPQGSSGTQAASSGGGVSAYIATPAWQTGVGVAVTRAGRYTPDVSFSASCHDAYFACFAAAGGSCVDDATGRFQFTSFCGTSASAPGMAGVAALLDDFVGAPQGNLNAQIYEVAANQATSSLPNSFHDITVASSGLAACDINTPSICNNSIPGPNGLSGGQPGYMLTDGYDEVTGLGSLDIASFLANYHPAPTIKILRTPPALTFDTRIVGTSETLQLDVVNTGASNMHALSLTFSGPNAADFTQTNNCPSQLGWDISCTIQVTFTPSAAGTRTATMTVASDNAVNSPKQVSLTGTGTTTLETPSVVVFPDSYITTAQPDHVVVNVYPQSGYPNPTGFVTLTGPGINLPAATLMNGSVSFTIPAGVLPVGDDALTASYAPDAASSSIYNPATGTSYVTVSVFKPTPVVTVTPSSSTVTTYQAFSITVDVSGGSGNPTPTGNVWVIIGPYLSGGNHLTNGSATINVPPGAIGGAGTDYISINVDGDDNYMPSTGGSPLNVTTPVGSFTFSAPNIAVSPGAATGNSTAVTITPSGGFTGSISLVPAISSSPTNAQHLPTLSFGTTPTITFMGSNPITASLYVFTTAPTQAAVTIPHRAGSRWYATGGATLSCIFFLCNPRRRRNLRNVLGAIALLTFVATGVLACGGGGTSGSGSFGNPGTTSGSYTITITGTSGPITASGTVSLTVQ